eukprot:1209408-Lingulodinium_polyedra.AAC.1
MEFASVRIAHRESGARSTRPHRCAALCKNCTTMRSTDRPPPQRLANRTLAHSTRMPEKTG